MHTRGSAWLAAAAAASFAVALLHVAIAFVGTPGYEYFAAPPNIVAAARRGSAVPPLITLVIALVFAIFGLYALSGAGHAPKLPLLRIVLVGISGIHLLRGAVLVPEIVMFLHAPAVPARLLVFSVVSLAIGVLYTVGTARRWTSLP